MDLGKPLKTIVVAYPNAGRRIPAQTPQEDWPIPLPDNWPRRRTEDAPLPEAEPARQAPAQAHGR